MGGSKWTPAKLSNVALWLDASDLTGNDGDAITTWTSKEGNAYAFTQSTAENKPLLKKGANGIGGQNTVFFDGTNDFLKYSAGDISNADQGFIIAVARTTNNNLSQTILSSYNESVTDKLWNFRIIRENGGTDYVCEILQQNGDTLDACDSNDTSPVANKPYLLFLQGNGTSYSMRINAANKSIVVLSGTNNGDWFADAEGRNNFILGVRQSNAGLSGYLVGDIAEIILSDAVISISDLNLLEQYLNKKYGSAFF